MARPLPRTTETERWYRVRGKRRRPRVILQTTEGRPVSPSGGKAGEAGRGSSLEPQATDKGDPGGREGRGEGRRRAGQLAVNPETRTEG